MSRAEPPEGYEPMSPYDHGRVVGRLVVDGACGEEIAYAMNYPWKYEHVLYKIRMEEIERYANTGEG